MPGMGYPGGFYPGGEPPSIAEEVAEGTFTLPTAVVIATPKTSVVIAPALLRAVRTVAGSLRCVFVNDVGTVVTTPKEPTQVRTVIIAARQATTLKATLTCTMPPQGKATTLAKPGTAATMVTPRLAVATVVGLLKVVTTANRGQAVTTPKEPAQVRTIIVAARTATTEPKKATVKFYA